MLMNDTRGSQIVNPLNAISDFLAPFILQISLNALINPCAVVITQKYVAINGRVD